MNRLKTALKVVTNEEIERASVLWQLEEPFKLIAYKCGWTEHLAVRVVRLCREFDDDDKPLFPQRRARKSKNTTLPNPVTKAELDDAQNAEVIAAAKKQRPISRTAWKKALVTKGCKPSTVKARRPADYLTARKLNDPTLSLPERRA